MMFDFSSYLSLQCQLLAIHVETQRRLKMVTFESTTKQIRMIWWLHITPVKLAINYGVMMKFTVLPKRKYGMGVPLDARKVSMTVEIYIFFYYSKLCYAALFVYLHLYQIVLQHKIPVFSMMLKFFDSYPLLKKLKTTSSFFFNSCTQFRN